MFEGQRHCKNLPRQFRSGEEYVHTEPQKVNIQE
uniref:Uncharacterized protein n=1 Tax=Arundo donax TaxID=35708 RepID=A0A0A8ZJZ5_ARUDO